YLQKTDIMKKIMWYAYPDAESGSPLQLPQVREYEDMNNSGSKSQDLKIHQEPVEEIEKPVSYDYENVVGQDSLTRLDEKNKKRRKKKPKQQREPGASTGKIAELKKIEPEENK